MSTLSQKTARDNGVLGVSPKSNKPEPLISRQERVPTLAAPLAAAPLVSREVYKKFSYDKFI